MQNFINGSFHGSENTIDSYDPSVGEVWARIPDSGKEEVDAAVQAAKAAFHRWSRTTVAERSRLLLRIADTLEARLEEFARAESRDQGKPLSLARTVDIPRAVYNFRFFGTSILHDVSESTILGQGDALNYVQNVPLGVAGLISPWNLPMYLLTWKIAPAIAYGNTCVAKPSEMTSITAWMLCKVFQDVGLPPGVVNVVFGVGPRAGSAIVSHPDVPLISFTGSTATGERIQVASAPYCKKLSLELGGKNAAVIFADANWSKCIPETVRSSFTNQGEVCLCTERIYVEESCFDAFIKAFVEETRKIRVGDPADSSTNMGALVSADHFAKVKYYIDLARKEAATVVYGYGADELVLPDHLRKGYYLLPTIITGISDDSAVMKEEIFGPVACVVPFRTVDEVVDKVNAVKYGLCATVWSQDVVKVHRVSQRLNVGTVWANCWMLRDLNLPFGGMKASGIGREGRKGSREFFTDEKVICVKID